MATTQGEFASKLIELYKSYTVLWHPKDSNYYKKELKEDAWKQIAATMDQSAEMCKRKMVSLLASYRREKAKERKRIRGIGKGAPKVYRSRWYAYEAFRFLEERDKPRKRTNIKSTEMIDDEDEEDSSTSEQRDDPMEQSQSFVTPMVQKRSKSMQQDELSKLASDEIQITKCATCQTKESPSSSNNEVTSFGNFIINKMLSYSPETRKGVEHEIFDILVKADKGYYEQSSYQNIPPHLNDP